MEEIDGTSSSTGAQPKTPSIQRAFDASTLEEEKARLVERSTYLETAILVRGDQYHATDETFEMLEELRTEFGRASSEIHSDRPTILAVMSANGELLELCKEQMKDDSEVVERAVCRSPWSLKYASQRLQDDRAIVIAAVRGDGASFRFASEELRSDRELILKASRGSFVGVDFASGDVGLLAEDMEVRAAWLQGRPFSPWQSPEKRGMDVSWRDRGAAKGRPDNYIYMLMNMDGWETCKDLWLVAARRAPPAGLDFLRELWLMAARGAPPVGLAFLEAEYERAVGFAPRRKWDYGSFSRLAMQIHTEWKLSWDDIWTASLSKLADPGHVAPRLTVDMRAAGATCYECKVTAMSGKSFTCQMPTFHPEGGTSSGTASGPAAGQEGKGPQPTSADASPAASNVADLAELLVELLPVHIDVQAKFVSIIFTADDGESVPVTVWDWNLPLATFARSS